MNCNQIRSFLKFKFVNKGMDGINFSNIFHNKRTSEKVLQYFQNRSAPVVSYRYSNTVAAKILSFNATIKNIDIDDFLKARHYVTVPHHHSDMRLMACHHRRFRYHSK